MTFFILLILLVPSPVSSIYQSYMTLSLPGYEFAPQNPIQFIFQTSFSSRLRCSSACNQRVSCRAFDYDSVSSRCRIFEGDLTTGSIVSSMSVASTVGIITVSPSSFSQMHNKSCEACQDRREEVCSAATNTCQCRLNTFWDGSMCSLQVFDSDLCSQIDAYRADLNLTCMMDYSGQFSNCSSSTYGNSCRSQK